MNWLRVTFTGELGGVLVVSVSMKDVCGETKRLPEHELATASDWSGECIMTSETVLLGFTASSELSMCENEDPTPTISCGLSLSKALCRDLFRLTDLRALREEKRPRLCVRPSLGDELVVEKDCRTLSEEALWSFRLASASFRAAFSLRSSRFGSVQHTSNIFSGDISFDVTRQIKWRWQAKPIFEDDQSGHRESTQWVIMSLVRV